MSEIRDEISEIRYQMSDIRDEMSEIRYEDVRYKI
jgi:hypothetical protein